jgi:MFS family permease
LHLQSALKTFYQSPAIWFAGGLESANYILLYALKAFLPVYALAAGMNVAVVGSFFALQEAVQIVLRPVAGRLGDRLGYLSLIAAGMILFGATVFWLVALKTQLLLLVAAGFLGLAQALVFSSSTPLVARRVDAANLGLSLGLLGTLDNAGKIAGPVLAGLLIARFDYQFAFQLLSLFLIAVALALVLYLLYARARVQPLVSSEGAD